MGNCCSTDLDGARNVKPYQQPYQHPYQQPYVQQPYQQPQQQYVQQQYQQQQYPTFQQPYQQASNLYPSNLYSHKQPSPPLPPLPQLSQLSQPQSLYNAPAPGSGIIAYPTNSIYVNNNNNNSSSQLYNVDYDQKHSGTVNTFEQQYSSADDSQKETKFPGTVDTFEQQNSPTDNTQKEITKFPDTIDTLDEPNSADDTQKEITKFPGTVDTFEPYSSTDDTQNETTKFPGTIDTFELSNSPADDTRVDQKSIQETSPISGSIYTETTPESHCLNCTSKLVDRDLDGYPSEYCSDQCRKEAAGFANPVCILCKEFPHVTGSKFCGKIRCRNLPKCYLCKVKDVHKGSLWCSKTCRDKTPNWQNLTIERSNYMCLVCGIEYSLKGRDFCRDECEMWVKNSSPCLLKLPQNAEKYKDVHNQFVAAWKHPHKQVPPIHAIWKIYCNNLMNNKYNSYRTEVEKIQQLGGKPFPKGDGRRTMSMGNEQRRFHGTKMTCQIGLQNNKVCDDKQCSVCSIIREGYKLKYVGTGTISAAFQRFGSGIYFSGTSSKSDDYNEGSLINYLGANYKVMLLNKVVVGKGYALTRDAMTLTSPPDGYDSVLGEPSAAGNLNYDEVVVYKESASIPQYLIVYKTV